MRVTTRAASSPAVRRRPYAVILFDEIEKAHPDVFNALLQIPRRRAPHRQQGPRGDFKNTVVIMTSNGSQLLMDGIDRAGAIPEAVRARVMEELRLSFSRSS